MANLVNAKKPITREVKRHGLYAKARNKEKREVKREKKRAVNTGNWQALTDILNPDKSITPKNSPVKQDKERIANAKKQKKKQDMELKGQAEKRNKEYQNYLDNWIDKNTYVLDAASGEIKETIPVLLPKELDEKKLGFKY